MYWNLNWDPHACAERTLTAEPSQPPACRFWIGSLSQWCLSTASPDMQHDGMDFSPLMTGHQRNYCVTKTHWIWFLWRPLSSPKSRTLQSLFDLPLWKNEPSLPCQACELHGEGRVQPTSMCSVSFTGFLWGFLSLCEPLIIFPSFGAETFFLFCFFLTSSDILSFYQAMFSFFRIIIFWNYYKI